MSGKGSKNAQQQPTNQTVTQTNLPEEMIPYLTRLMDRSEGVTAQPYQPYGGQRIADFGHDTQGSFQGVRNNQGSYAPYMAGALGATQQAGNMAMRAGGARPMTIEDYQMGPVGDIATGQWNSQARDQYMNPYTEGVLDVAQRRAQRQFDTSQIASRDAAIRGGAFGSTGDKVASALARSEFGRQVADSEMTGLGQAYQAAMQGFQQDQGRALEAGRSNQQTRFQTGKSNLDAMMGSQQLRAQQGLQYDQMGLQAAELMKGLGGQWATLGQQRSAQGYEDARQLREVGLSQDSLRQSRMDLGYEDFVNQRDYERQNLGFLSGILRGVPMPVSSNVTQYQATNPFSQMMGAGLGMAGLYQQFSGGGGGGK